MSAAMTPLAVEALIQLVPLATTLIDQVKNGTQPTPEQIAALDAALDKANEAIQNS